jgi:FimV-like protein
VAAYDAQEIGLLNAGVDAQKLRDIRARHPKLGPVAPLTEAAPVIAPMEAPGDEFQLNLDDLSMDASWDLASPFENPSPTAELANETALPDPEIEWQIDIEASSPGDGFLDDFTEPRALLELEPLKLEPESASVGKLEQAQSCIDDGDLDSAIELLNELLKEADEPLKQTARSLLAGIR